MADAEVMTPSDNATTKPEAEQAVPATRSRQPRLKKAKPERTSAAGQKTEKPKARGLSSEEKFAKLKQVDAAVAGGATLKDAVSAVSISDQTYYVWKKAIATPLAVPSVTTTSFDDDFAEFVQLEEENRRLRTLLAEKLRGENAELRKKLGIS